MPRHLSQFCAVLAPLALAASLFSPAHALVSAPAITALTAAATTDRLIVKLRDPAPVRADLRIDELGGRRGYRLQHLRQMSGGAQVVRLAARLSRAEAAAVARQLASDPAVAYVEPDIRLLPQRIPNDPMYAQQWHYFEPAGGINLPAAWDITTGSASITVAVLDSGIVNHPDLAARVVPGYDFVSDVTMGNDGNGRDSDASDPGDYGCGGSSSSWHGTHVAGTIGAVSNNGSGVSGINWASKIQSVRVLGQCGGYTSDIADGVRWAAGIAVAGAPANPTPARVLNLSLGGAGSCGTTFQNAINDATARGAVVVVAAGNSGDEVANYMPANCTGVIAVAATGRNGGRASFSNFGTRITIAAPGAGGILSTLNAGATVPAAPSYAYYQGTSMATPHVAGVVSLMLSANPALTPTQVRTMLQASARAFPTGTGSDCTTSLCGAGIVDAAAALRAAVPAPPPEPGVRMNWALAANGAVTSASSTHSSGYAPAGANDGQRSGRNWGSGGGWNDATWASASDWMQVDFGAVRSVAEVAVFSVQDAYTTPVEPTEAMTFSRYGLVDFELQYWNGTAWLAIPGGSVAGNDRVWRKVSFAPVTTSAIRIVVIRAQDGWSRIAEIEAYASTETPPPPAPSPPITNVALAANGGSASASSSHSSPYPASATIDGDRRGTPGSAGGGYWNDATWATFPDFLQVNLSSTKTVSEINVFGIQDHYTAPAEPTEALTFSRYGLVDFEVQYWNGTAWVVVPGGNVVNNDRIWRKFSFPEVSTNSVRIVVLRAADGWSRIAEVEVLGR